MIVLWVDMFLTTDSLKSTIKYISILCTIFCNFNTHFSFSVIDAEFKFFRKKSDFKPRIGKTNSRLYFFA